MIDYDTASQVTWTAAGQSGSTTACDYTSVPISAQTSYGYSLVGLRTSITYPDTSGNVTLGYDNDGNLTSANNPTAAWTYGYDKRGLLESESVVIDGKTFLLTHGYNTGGLQSSIIYPDNVTLSYIPDAWGRPTELGILATNIVYYPNGVPKTYSIGNGFSYSAQINARQWLSQVTLSTPAILQGFVYGYDNEGNLNSFTDSADSANNVGMSYDGLNRLKVASGCWGDYSYVYDTLNNIQDREGTHSLGYHYDTSNRLSSVGAGDDIFADGFDSAVNCPAPPAVVRSYQYDAQGRPTSDGVHSYVWNRANQITNVTGVASYAYDGRGKRIKATHGGITEYALYDLTGQLIYTDNGTTKADYANLAGKPLAQVTTNGITYLHPDVLGSPRLGTSNAAQVQWHEHYDPYGVKMSGVVEKLGYTGHAYDAESGLTYAQTRYYDPAIGRFLSTDPAPFNPDNPFTFNRYSYGLNNPYKAIDRSGGEAACITAGVDCFGRSPEQQAFGAELLSAVGDGLEWLDREVFAPMGPYGAPEELIGTAAIGLIRPAVMDAEAAARLAANAARGRAAEARVLQELGMVKNTQKVFTSEGAAIPDAMTSDLVVEIKNSARVDFTRQLRIETEAGQQAGKQSVLVTGSNTCVSGNCQQAFDSIIRLDYLGPQNIPVPQAEP